MQRESCSYLPNMRAIQCNLAMIGRNVSNLSPHASYMMDGVFLWQRETQRSQREVLKCIFVCFGDGVCVCVCVERAFMHISVCSVDTLWRFLLCLCSCFSNLTCWFGRAMQELLIQELDVVMWNANSTLHACQIELVIFARDWPHPAYMGCYRCVHKLIDMVFYSFSQYAKVTSSGLDLQSLLWISLRVANFYGAVCFQFSRVFNNPNRINDYSWS